jgi:hypothetical protein
MGGALARALPGLGIISQFLAFAAMRQQMEDFDNAMASGCRPVA